MHARFASSLTTPLTGWRPVLLSMLAALALSACGGGGNNASFPTTTPSASATPTTPSNPATPETPAVAVKPELRCAP